MANILIVEDNSLIAMKEAYCLWNAGHDVKVVSSGRKALDWVDHENPDLIILDYELPDMSGLEVLRVLNQNLPRPPVVLVTGKGDEKLAVQMMKEGVNDYLVKSSKMVDSLVSTVELVLREDKIRQELERKKEALRKSEETTRVLLNVSHDAALLVEREGRILAGNKAAAEQFGAIPGEIISPSVPGFSLSERAVGGKTQRDLVLESGKPAHFEADRNGRHFENTIWPVFGDDKSVTRYAVYARDVTEHWEAEEALRLAHSTLENRVEQRTADLAMANVRLEHEVRERSKAEKTLRISEEKFRNLAENSIQGILVFSHDFHPIYANQALADIFGVTGPADILAKKNILDLICSGDRRRIRNIVKQCFRGKKSPTFFQFQGIKKKKAAITLLGNGALVNWEDQQVFQSVLIDITDRQQAEDELSRLATAVDQAAESIIITDAEGTIQYVNPAFERSSGYPKEEAIGRNPSILKSGKQDEDDYRYLWETLKKGEKWTGSFINKRRDGTLYHEEATISPVRGSNGRIISYIGIQRDVTNEQQLEAKLHQAQKMEALGALAGGVAHDFNNILTPIFGYADLASKDLPSDSKAQKDLDAVKRAALRAKELVSQILLFSRQSKVERKPIRLDSLTKEVLKLLHSALPSTITVNHRIPANLDMVVSDITQIHTLLMNLCTNAFHAMPEGGFLNISLENVDSNSFELAPDSFTKQRFVRLEVRDTGVGMDKKTLTHIFDPYFTTKEAGKGTGLGLSTVHGIVQQNGGEIMVDTELGKGTAFIIFLPSAPGKIGKAVPSIEPVPQGSETILFVDDEKEIAKLAKAGLEFYGYRVTAVSDPREALERFKEQKNSIDMLITDMTMPGMTGEKLAGIVRKLNPALPVILCTGNLEFQDAGWNNSPNIDEVVTKPYRYEELARIIRNVLDTAMERTRKM